MPRKKPCRICRRWFEPHPRAGARQHVCSGCQRERHRRSCADWHARNPDYDKKRRLRDAAGLDRAADADDPIDAVIWPVVERAIGPAHRTVIEAIARLLASSAREAVRPETPSSMDESGKQLNIAFTRHSAPGNARQHGRIAGSSPSTMRDAACKGWPRSLTLHREALMAITLELDQLVLRHADLRFVDRGRRARLAASLVDQQDGMAEVGLKVALPSVSKGPKSPVSIGWREVDGGHTAQLTVEDPGRADPAGREAE